MRLSAMPVTTSLPSGVEATALTASTWPVKVAEHPARPAPAGAREAPAVGAEGDGEDDVRALNQLAGRLGGPVRPGLPEFRRAGLPGVTAGRRQPAAVGAVSEGVDPLWEAAQPRGERPVRHSPEVDLVIARGGDSRAVRAECQGGDRHGDGKAVRDDDRRRLVAEREPIVLGGLPVVTCPLSDSTLDQGDLRRGEGILLEGHPRLAVVADQLHELAGLGLARLQGDPPVRPAFGELREGGEVVLALGLLRVGAHDAVPHEDRRLVLEEDDGGSGRGHGRITPVRSKAWRGAGARRRLCEREAWSWSFEESSAGIPPRSVLPLDSDDSSKDHDHASRSHNRRRAPAPRHAFDRTGGSPPCGRKHGEGQERGGDCANARHGHGPSRNRRSRGGEPTVEGCRPTAYPAGVRGAWPTAMGVSAAAQSFQPR